MTHYEQRLEHDLDVIRERLTEISSRVESAVERSVTALLRRDRALALAAQIILGDLPINRATREVESLCHAFIALHLPSAGHLRYVSSVMRLMVAVERVGDYAVTIARQAVQLHETPPAAIARDLETMANLSLRQLSLSLQAFVERNPEMAREVEELSGQSKNLFRAVLADLLAEGRAGVSRDLFALLGAVNRLDRVGDQAKNICEEAVFAATGRTKQPKVYRVLFVDEANTFRSVIAQAVARKRYPESGRYESGGWAPGNETEVRVAELLARHGHAPEDHVPSPVPTRVDELDEYHVIVGLEGDVAEHLTEIPFHTAIVGWPVGPGPDDAGWELADASLETLYRDLSVRVRDLMETLRGDDAT